MNTICRANTTTRPKHTPAVYRRAAVTHSAQLIPVTLAVGFALVTVSALVAICAFAFGELLLLVVAPHLGLLQRSIDDRFDRGERAVAVMARASLLMRLSELQRHEYEELERLTLEIRDRSAQNAEAGVSPDHVVERWLGLERLLISYIRIALAHRKNAESFGAEKRAALDAQVARLNVLQLSGRVRAHGAIDRQRAVLALRERTWSRALDERDVFAQELATIANVIRWMHELCAVVPSDAAEAELDQVLAKLDSEHMALAEAIRDDETDSLDPRVLELGRETALLSPGLVVPTIDAPHQQRPALSLFDSPAAAKGGSAGPAPMSCCGSVSSL